MSDLISFGKSDSKDMMLSEDMSLKDSLHEWSACLGKDLIDSVNSWEVSFAWKFGFWKLV